MSQELTDGVPKPVQPRLQPRDGDRRATWLELFFDLVFVAAITSLGGQLAAQSTVFGMAAYLALFIPIWWAWVGHTVYSNRFDEDDLIYRGLTWVMMLAAAGMAVQFHHIHEGWAFAAAYGLARVALLALYARERHIPHAHFLRRLYLRGFGIGATLWLLSLLVPPPGRYALWFAGMAVDLATPWIGRKGLKKSPLNVAHLPERMGLFTLILLGESLVVAVDTISHAEWGPAPVVLGLFAFGIAAAIWWNYFAFVEATPFFCRLGSGQPYLYTHLPLALGMTALAAGIRRAIHEADLPTLSTPTLILLGGGAAAWLLSFLAVKAVSLVRLERREVVLYAAAAAAVAVVAALGVISSPFATFGGLSLIFVAAVTLDQRGNQAAWRVSYYKRSKGDPMSTEAPPCAHLDEVHPVSPHTKGCEECLKTGDTWVHLRLCLTCGHVGCCDDSKNTHATKHFRATDHAIIRSIEPGETWAWCYKDELFFPEGVTSPQA